MSEPFVAEIRIFGGNFAIRGWAFCDGQLLPIAQYTALFSLIGTYYGGNGQTTFQLPNLQGRAPMQHGQGPGLTPRQIGESLGAETVTLSQTTMPNHTHGLRPTVSRGSSSQPQGNAFNRSIGDAAYTATTPSTGMSPAMVADSGSNQAHNNMQPFLTMNYIIALQGIYPSRS